MQRVHIHINSLTVEKQTASLQTGGQKQNRVCGLPFKKYMHVCNTCRIMHYLHGLALKCEA